MDSRKRSSCFILTINQFEWDKTCICELFVSCVLISKSTFGEESYHPALDPLSGDIAPGDHGKHHHCFVRFKKNYFFK
jgi:hypothetical protein